MQSEHDRPAGLEARLRQSVPPLREPDHARVNRVCERLLSAPSAAPLRGPHLITKPLLRVAASFVLLFGLALLLRSRHPQRAAASVSPSALFNDLAALMSTPALENTLASEADDLASDLANLTAVLNDRTQEILF